MRGSLYVPYMRKKPFKEIIIGDGLELRRPVASRTHSAAMFDVLQRNDFFYPWRFSLRDCKSPDDCLRLIIARLAGIHAMTDDFYDIFVDNKYVGEVYARDINYKTGRIGNLGYFVDKDVAGCGIASRAVSALESELWTMGAREIILSCHFFDKNDRNWASEKVAAKCGYEFIGIRKRAIYDKFGDRWADENQFMKKSR